MRALPSSSRDLPLLLPEWMLFALLQMAACCTLETLARGTGLRGDATRAPMQVRNGWRPHRRHLTQPASLSKDEPIFVQTMGSTSVCLKKCLGMCTEFYIFSRPVNTCIQGYGIKLLPFKPIH